jgi:hypothetical protein
MLGHKCSRHPEVGMRVKTASRPSGGRFPPSGFDPQKSRRRPQTFSGRGLCVRIRGREFFALTLPHTDPRSPNVPGPFRAQFYSCLGTFIGAGVFDREPVPYPEQLTPETFAPSAAPNIPLHLQGRGGARPKSGLPDFGNTWMSEIGNIRFRRAPGGVLFHSVPKSESHAYSRTKSRVIAPQAAVRPHRCDARLTAIVLIVMIGMTEVPTTFGAGFIPSCNCP